MGYRKFVPSLAAGAVRRRGPAGAQPGRRGLELWAPGSAGFAGFNLLTYLGLGSSTPQHAAVFVALMPILTVAGGLGLGDLLFFLGVASFVVYTLGARRFPGYSPLRYTALSAAGGTATILAVTEIVTLAGAEHAPTLADLGADAWQVGYVVLIGAVIAVLAFNEASGASARTTRRCSAT